MKERILSYVTLITTQDSASATESSELHEGKCNAAAMWKIRPCRVEFKLGQILDEIDGVNKVPMDI